MRLRLFDPSGVGHSVNMIDGLTRAARALGVEVAVDAPARELPADLATVPWNAVSVPLLADRAGRRAYRAALAASLAAESDIWCDLNVDRTVRTRARRIAADGHCAFVLHQLNVLQAPPGATGRDAARKARKAHERVRVMQRVGATGAAILVNSPAVLDRVAGLVPPERIRLVHWPVAHRDAPTLAPDWSSRPEAVTLLFAGTARRAKGLDVLLQAIPAVRGFDRLVVPGSIPTQLRGGLDLSDPRVDLWDRFLEPEEYAATMAGAALVMLPYRRTYVDQGISSAVLAEAMAAGRPLVVSEALGPQLPPGYRGAVVADAEDPAAFARGIERALGDLEALTAAAMTEGREFVRRHHTYEGYLEQLADACGHPLAAPTTGAGAGYPNVTP
jgi:glycosyltransferase involved in cell wall biosynthesis